MPRANAFITPVSINTAPFVSNGMMVQTRHAPRAGSPIATSSRPEIAFVALKTRIA
jgi:hypothetical protein